MKAKKIVIGAVSAAILSLSVCSIAPVFAAGETVQISVGKISANAGETFSVDVSLTNVPANGIQCCNFAIKYDSSLVTVDSVEAGELTNTSANKDDPSSSVLALFDSNIEDGVTAICWSTALDDPSEWMNGDGVFCTIKGTVAEGASGVIPLKVVPVDRDTYPGSHVDNDAISVGYFHNKEVVRYTVSIENGEIAVGGSTGSTGSGEYLKGDANVDGKVSIADAVLIMQALSNPNDFQLTEQGSKNADVNGKDGVTTADALEIQKHDIGLPSDLD